MSIKDSTGTARTFALLSTTGTSKSYAGVSTVSPTLFNTKSTMSAKPLGYNQFLTQAVVNYSDAELNPRRVKVNFTIEVPNELTEANVALRDAVLFVVRSVLLGADDQTGTPASLETALDYLARGIQVVP